MRAVWSEEDPTTCVHPGTRLFPGTETIMETWRYLFEEFAAFEVEATEMFVVASGEFGMIVSIERYLDVTMRNPEAAEEGEEEEGEDEEEEDDDEELVTDDESAAADEGEDEVEDEDDEDLDEDDDDGGERLLIATHAFRRDPGGWRLAHRHTSAFQDEGDFVLALKTLQSGQN